MIDWWLILFIFGLVGVGFVAISTSVEPEYVRGDLIKQGAAFILGLIAWVIFALLDYNELRGLSRFLYIASMLMLASVLVFGVNTRGNQNWLQFGSINVQPSELAKVLLIVTLAKLLDNMERLHSWFDLLLPIAHVLPVFGMVIWQGDLGSALIFIAISIILVFAAGFPLRKFIAVGLLGATLLFGMGYAHYAHDIHFPLRKDQWKRIDAFLDPEAHLADGGYQVVQSMTAIGTGQFWGKGLGLGERHRNGWLPDSHTDFIFAVIGEEFGFVGGAVVIGLYGLIFFRLASVAYSARDRYGGLIVIGVAGLLGGHVLENIGMTMGLAPVTGIPLPFVSYGPTSLVANMAAMGLVHSVAARREPIPFDR